MGQDQAQPFEQHTKTEALYSMKLKSLLFIALAALALPCVAQQPSREVVRGTEYTAVGASWNHETFRGTLSDWNLYSVELKRKNARGSIIGRVTHGDRFDRTGQQFEIDAYPKLAPGVYAYLNAGYSDDPIFPNHRLGAQIYKSLPRSWEASLGLRWLDFESRDVTIWTGSVGKYRRNWYFSAQPYVSDKDTGTSASLHGIARRYFRTGDDYFGVRAGYGEVPEQDIRLENPADLVSWSARVEGKRRITPTWIINGSVGVRDEELRQGSSRESVFASLGLETRF